MVQSAGLTNSHRIRGIHVWMRRHISSKSGTCTEGMGVYAAGISVKVGMDYPARSVGEAGGGDRVEILWHRRETSRQTEKTNIDLRLCGRQPTLRGVAEPTEVSRGHTRWVRPH